MDTFVWDQNFVTGLSQVDEQHRKLVDLFNELSHSLFLSDANREAVLTDTFARVVDYTRYHFQDEEALMRAEGVDSRHIDAHHAMHEQFVAQVSSMWERRNSLSAVGEGLLMIDVDFFKRYNDSYGHQAGDACLQAVAKAVQKALQRSTDLVARYGGEELAVILPDTDQAGTQAVAARVVAEVMALALPHKASDAAPVVTVSVGAACRVPSAQDNAPFLLTLADEALYRAKATGRNRWAAAT